MYVPISQPKSPRRGEKEKKRSMAFNVIKNYKYGRLEAEGRCGWFHGKGGLNERTILIELRLC